MSPILAMRYLVEDFTDSFDLIGDRLSKSLIQDILSEYEKIWAEDPDDFNVAYDCEILLTLLGEHEKAITCLDRIDVNYGTGMRMLRRSAHYACLQNKKAAEKALHPLLTNPRNEHEKECFFIAAGRRGDQETAVRLWAELISEKELENQRFNDEILGNPESFNCLSHQHIREWDEGIRLLYRYHIRENRDIELCALISMLHYKVGIIYNSIIDMILNNGPYEAFTSIIVAHAVTSGTHSLITEYRDMVVIDESGVYQELILNLEGVRKFLTFFTLAERLLTIPIATFQPDESFLHNLVRETGGDMYQVYSVLELFTQAGNDADYAHLMDILLNIDPDIGRRSVIRKEMDGYLGPRPPFDYE